jgi:low temperature requirement protein LtrA
LCSACCHRSKSGSAPPSHDDFNPIARAQDLTPSSPNTEESSVSTDAEGVVVGEERTTPLELFFDLVFVYAITQTAKVLTLDPSAAGFARAAVLLASVWYAWICFAWLTNSVDIEDGVLRIGIIVAAGASFLVAVAVPKALSDDALLFVSAYFVVRLLHVTLYAYGLRAEPYARRAILGLAPTFVTGPAALFALPWLPAHWRLPFLLSALVLDVSSPYISGVAGFRVRPAHFAERFSLFVIITLGESIVAIGVGTAGHDLTVAVIAAVALAFLLTVFLWWAYFDVVALAAEERLTQAGSGERALLARDAYTYLHYPLVAGIVGFAYGCKKMVSLTTAPLSGAGAVALCGGVAVYLLCHAAFRLRMTRSFGLHHLTAAGASLALLSFASRVPALVCGGILGLVLLAALAWERRELHERRRLLRRSLS